MAGVNALLLGLALAGPLDELDQVLPEARAEVPIDRQTRWMVPMPVVHSDGSEWVLVLRGEADALELTWYDAGLEPVDATLVEAPRGAYVRDWVVDQDAVFVLFAARGPRDVWVAELPVRPGPLGLERFDAPKRFAPSELAVDGEDLYVRGSYIARTAVLEGQAGTGRLDAIDLPEELPRVRLGRMAPSDEGGVELVVHEWRRKGRGTWLVRAEGDAVDIVQGLRPEEGEPTPLTAQRVELEDGRLVVGTYAASPRASSATGVYVARYEEGARAWQQTHAFADMEGFFSYLPERAEARLSRKAERRAKKGKALDLGYQLVVHDLARTGEDVLLVAEAFVPVYTTQTRTETTLVNGQMVTRTVTTQVFLGWSHTHALVAALGLDGSLRWAHTFAMGERLYPTLAERVAVGVDAEGLTLRFAAGSRLISKRIAGGEVLAERAEERISGGEVLRAWSTGAAPWGEDFLLWGQERVLDEEGRRRVFFLARLED